MNMAENTLKLCGEPVVPGLALPKAFEDLEKQLESVASLCKLKGSHEAQTTGLLLVCNELQRLLRLSFIENGILASRIEILTRYQDECIKKFEKRLRGFETEQKVTHKYLKNLRKRQYNYEKIKKSKDKEWWKIDVSSSDYESISGLSRISGNPNLEFMLRLNQLLLDFVKDPYTNELLLPPMGNEERAELSRLASLYKLRCRYNKSTQVATSTIIKARQTCIPGSGEVDAILNTFTKKQKDGPDGETETTPGSPKDDKDGTTSIEDVSPNKAIKTSVTNPKSSALPSYMLTPVSTMGTPTITLEGEPVGPSSQVTKKPASSGDSDTITPTSRPSSVRVTKIDTRSGPSALLQLIPDGTGGMTTSSTPTLSSTTPKPQMVLPSSTATAYTNLLSSANSSFPTASPAALHMALLMQSQQLRALTAAVTAGQNNAAASGTGSSAPTPPSSGISTVLATPLPPSLSSTSSSLQTRTSPTTGSGTKRDSTSSTSSSKRSKLSTRRSAGNE